MDKNPLSAKWCRAHGVALLNNSPPFLVAVSNDCDELLLAKLQQELNAPVNLRNTPAPEIRRLQNEYSSATDRETLLSQNELPQSNSWESEPIVNLVENLLDDAIRQKATDIHLEPSQKSFRIRLRQDGLLNDYKTLPTWVAEPVLIRLKVLSEIDITDKRIPHDGSFTFCSSKGNANIRISTLPVQGGEKCVLRLLPQNDESNRESGGLSTLNLDKPSLDFLRQVFQAPQGLFLVTGPTGSGKTTTLHAGLREILHRHINVTTVEDPVEYELCGANQVQVNDKCGFTFAAALRSILRQDPDVIMVGEIRDQETAQIALRAAQTGHLVVSTLHTNSAKAAYTRLKDLGISESMLEDSILGIMAQRLVRRKESPEHPYTGRIAIAEILKPNGEYVDGTLRENARRLVQAGLTDEPEIRRVFGS